MHGMQLLNLLVGPAPQNTIKHSLQIVPHLRVRAVKQIHPWHLSTRLQHRLNDVGARASNRWNYCARLGLGFQARVYVHNVKRIASLLRLLAPRPVHELNGGWKRINGVNGVC